MRLKVGQLEPGMSIQLLNDGAPMTGLDELGVTVTMRGTRYPHEQIVDASPTLDPDTATVTHEWVAGETDVEGRIFWVATVDLGDGRPIDFPSYSFEACDVEP